jgi:hypothetical protein
MILEGVVTTLGPGGAVNVAPMGPRVDPADWSSFELRPYRTSRTHANLRAHPEGVLHVTDDVLLLARAAVGEVEPPWRPAEAVRGAVLTGACRAYEFRVGPFDGAEERPRLRAEVVKAHRLRDFFGLNRAMHAVVEAAILATRTAFLPLGEIEADYRRLAVLVEKTGGPAEREAFALLAAHLARVKAGGNSP